MIESLKLGRVALHWPGSARLLEDGEGGASAGLLEDGEGGGGRGEEGGCRHWTPGSPVYFLACERSNST
jgi:hypothetical protein